MSEENILDKRLDELCVDGGCFSVRLVNILKYENINTVRDLICKPASFIKRLDGLGKKYMWEIENILSLLNLQLGSPDKLSEHSYNYLDPPIAKTIPVIEELTYSKEVKVHHLKLTDVNKCIICIPIDTLIKCVLSNNWDMTLIIDDKGEILFRVKEKPEQIYDMLYKG